MNSMKKLTPEQRDWIFRAVERYIGIFDLTDTFQDALNANTEPEDERKRFPKGKPSSMEDIFMEYPHTEPEDEPVGVCPSCKEPVATEIRYRCDNSYCHQCWVEPVQQEDK